MRSQRLRLQINFPSFPEHFKKGSQYFISWLIYGSLFIITIIFRASYVLNGLISLFYEISQRFFFLCIHIWKMTPCLVSKSNLQFWKYWKNITMLIFFIKVKLLVKRKRLKILIIFTPLKSLEIFSHYSEYSQWWKANWFPYYQLCFYSNE